MRLKLKNYNYICIHSFGFGEKRFPCFIRLGDFFLIKSKNK